MRNVIAGVVGGIIVFVWGAIAHLATPLGTAGLRALPNEAPVIEALKANVPQSGLYFFPGVDMSRKPTPEEQKAWEAKLRAGPSGLIVYTAGGMGAMEPRQLVTELISDILAAVLAAILLSFMAVPYITRAVAPALFALYAFLSLTVSHWNWYHFPTAFVTAELVTEFIGWLLAGLAMAKILTAPSPPA